MLRRMHPRATLSATILGSSLAFIDGSVVNVALPALAHDLKVDPANLSWAINAYLLPLGALILLGGALGDHFGRRRLFQIGLSTFTLASVLCAAAPSLPWLLAARGLQGFGAALLMPNSLAILGGGFAGEARGRAIGSWAAAGALAGALGPVAGGWIVDTVGWRTIFLINVPIAAGAGYLAWKYVEERKAVRPAPLDVAGAALATTALGLLTWALTMASESTARHAWVWSATLAGLVLLGAFLRHEGKLGDRALMPFALFAAPTFVGLTLLTLFLYGSLGGLIVLLPFFLIKIENWLAVAAGAALLPVPLLIGLVSRLMGRVASRHGPRLPLAVGSGAVAVGLALYGGIDAHGIDYWRDIFPPTLLVAVGMGACVAPLTAAVMTSVDPDRVGLASGFNNAVARIAGLIATALLGFVFARQESIEAFMVGFRAAALIGAASAALAAGFALVLVEPRRAPAP
ncbi:MAG TPA: MFS transporter [Steroidobacteraceae bacterium]|jgi:EmrB/QacA subfamily drug resistance transporter|nr:MFS transporter [Steroidobacteraceae bacterium]